MSPLLVVDSTYELARCAMITEAPLTHGLDIQTTWGVQASEYGFG